MSSNPTDTVSPPAPMEYELPEFQEFAAPALQPQMAEFSLQLVMDEKLWERLEKFAKLMASGRSTIPEHLRGNAADCLAIILQAIRWKMDPFAVAQKTHLVNGQLGYEAQLVHAALIASGVTKDRFNYEWYGEWKNVLGKTKLVRKEEPGKKPYEYRVPTWSSADEEGLGVKIWATVKGEDSPRVLELDLVQAAVRNSPLWASDPRQQIAYLGEKRWARLHTPDVILGVYTPDELAERSMKDLNPSPSRTAPRDRVKPQDLAERRMQQQGIPAEDMEALLKDARAAANKGTDAFAELWKKLKPQQRGALRAEVPNLEILCKQADDAAAGEKKRKDDEARRKSAAAEPVDADFVKAMDDADRKNRSAPPASIGDYVPE